MAGCSTLPFSPLIQHQFHVEAELFGTTVCRDEHTLLSVDSVCSLTHHTLHIVSVFNLNKAWSSQLDPFTALLKEQMADYMGTHTLNNTPPVTCT